MGVTGLRNFVMAIRKLVLTLVSLEVVSWARAEKKMQTDIYLLDETVLAKVV